MKHFGVIVVIRVEAENRSDAVGAVMALLDDEDDAHWQIDSTEISAVLEVVDS